MVLRSESPGLVVARPVSSPHTPQWFTRRRTLQMTDSPAPPPNRMLSRTLKIVLALAIATTIIFGGTLAWSLQAETSDFAFVPRTAQATLPVVTLEGQQPPPKGAGAMYFSTIGVRHATVFESWFGVGGGGELVPEHAILAPGESEDDRTRLDTVAMNSSQDNATVVGLRGLGYDVTVKPLGVRIVGIDPRAPAAQAGLQIGDVITAIGTTPITTIQTLRDAIRAIGAKQPVTATIKRSGTSTTITTTTIAGPNGTVLLGIVPAQANQIDTPRTVRFSVEGVGGPSAGLSFALQIYSAGKNYTDLHGLKVAATGTLTMTGIVGEVGGAAQKAIGAARADADLFLVPKADEAEARAAAPPGVEVVGVERFTDALNAIAAAAAAQQ